MPQEPSALTKAQLETLRRKLEDERRRLARVLNAPPPEASDDDGAEVEEAAQRVTERTHQVEIAARERALLAEVEHALAKFDAGTYGTSERTGAPIPYPRLAAIPWARFALDE